MIRENSPPLPPEAEATTKTETGETARMVTASKQMKYATEVAMICASGHECPPNNAVEKDITAYRWVKKPISSDCFKPQALRNPRRLHSAKDLEEKCSCWGLSMHTSLEASTTAFQTLEGSFRNARKIFGDWIAEGTISNNHGRCTPVNHSGHFDLHEYKNNSVAAVFNLCSSIPVLP